MELPSLPGEVVDAPVPGLSDRAQMMMEIAARHGLDRARLYTAIAEGTRGTEMPAWDKVLTPQEIANVAEYVYRAFIALDETDDGSVVR